jgi:hypothetical protein
VGRAGPVPLMARQLLVAIRQGKFAFCVLFPPFLTPLIGFSRVSKSKQTSLQDKHGPPAAVLGTDAPRLQVYCSARFPDRGHRTRTVTGTQSLVSSALRLRLPWGRNCSRRRETRAPKLSWTSDRAGTGRQDQSTASKRSGSGNRDVRLQCATSAPSMICV